MASNGTRGDDDITARVIQHRLLIDGDGVGDDQKLSALLHSFLTYFEKSESDENDDASMEHFKWQIRELEYVAEKTVSSIHASERDSEEHVKMGNTLRTEILRAEQLIDEYRPLVPLLPGASSYKKLKSAVGQICSKPDRYLSEAKIVNLEKELNIMKAKANLLGEEMDEQKRAITMLSSSVQLLRDLNNSKRGTYRHRIKNSEANLPDNK